MQNLKCSFCDEGTNPVIDDDHGNPNVSSEELESEEEMIQAEK